MNYNLSIYKVLIISLTVNISISICDTFRHVTNITSLLNTTNIQNLDESLLVATSGGIYTYNPETDYFKSYVNELNDVNIKVIALNNEMIWLGGDIIQILDNNFQLVTTIDYLDIKNVRKIIFSNNNIFILAEYDDQHVVLEFINNDIPNYQNLYNFDSFDINRINDILVIDDYIYIATDKGLLYADFVNTNLLLNSSWSIDYENREILFLINDNNQIQNFSKYNNEYCLFDICDTNIDTPVGIAKYLNDYLLITEKNIYEISTQFDKVYDLDINSEFQDIVIKENKIYCALENYGFLNVSDDDLIIPNTIFQNNFKSIDIKNNKVLTGISNRGGFIIEDIYSDLQNFNAKNFYPLYYHNGINNVTLMYPNSIDHYNTKYYGKTLNYLGGESNDVSIKFDINNNVKFIISHLRLNQEEFNYIGYDWLINNGVEYISLLFDLDQNNISINSSYGDDIFSGLQGYYNASYNDNFTVLRHMLYDKNNNLWIVNPYSETNENNTYVNKPLAVQTNDDEWIFIQDNTEGNAFLPTEIAFDDYNNAWVAYQYETFNSDNGIYSPGGIKVLEINNLSSEDYSWYSNPMNNLNTINCTSTQSNNLKLTNANVWSIDIGKDRYGNTILWILTDVGVMGYIVDFQYSQFFNNLTLNLSPLSCNFYFSDLYFNQDSHIRVDNQGNAWITTNDGIRVIKSNGKIWPNNFNINTEHTKLLSNQINDIVFDDNGYVYISNDRGISIFESSFGIEKNIQNFSISPNPYIPQNHDIIKLTNLPTYATIQVMTLSGEVLKDFKTYNETSILDWDGKNSKGSYLETGIYLIAVYSDKYGRLVNKLAVINN